MSETPYHFIGGSDDNEDGNLLKIYCRIKPLVDTEPCISVISKTKIIASPPSTAASNKQLQFTFKHVFSPEATQKDVFDHIAFPLVKKVLQGESSLLFTYGNTGSGKTYTMKGTLNEGGIMPRCLDVIFNSITQKLANKHIFKSDKFNGYEIQSEKDALSDLKKGLLNQIGNARGLKAKLGKKHNSDPDLAGRFIDPTQILMVNNKNSFAVFVNFVEVYNNSVYDLLDDSDKILHKQPQAKIIREDSKKNMFVQGVTEVEVSSTEEAYEIFYKGLKRRRIAQTLLNTHSSRSHSIFTIRVLQADISKTSNGNGSSNHIPITVGQLSLVDLAGSERTSRTHNVGKNLVEAGNINNSLMTLRLCFDALKENLKGGSKVVPYRDSKLTTLFRNFFEGDCFISMIVCINPHRDDYDESLQVLNFSESSQEVFSFVSLKKQIEMEETNRKMQIQSQAQALEDKVKLSMLQFRRRMEEAIPVLPKITFSENDQLDQIKAKCTTIFDILNAHRSSVITRERCEYVYEGLATALKNKYQGAIENEALKSSLRREQEQRISVETEQIGLKRKLDEAKNQVKRLKKELAEKDKTVLKAKAEKDLEKEKMLFKKNVYKEKFNSELEKLKRQRTELEMEIISRGDKLARVERVLSDEVISTTSTPSVASCRAKFERIATPASVISTPRMPHSEQRPTARRGNVAVSNRRHRRSKSAGDVWVEHKPAMPVPLNTVMQPSMPKRRSITKLTDAKQVTQGASKYCLMTQTQDSDGDLETRLYKADVIPTSGGGAQVLFNDIEVLKQVSPDSNPKRAPRDEIIDPQPSCSYGIEGHKLRSRRNK